MANFQASLYNSGILGVSVVGANLTITDYSNYDTNSQFAQSEFDKFRKIKVTQPDGTDFLFSSLGDGDAPCITPKSATLPITDQYAYDSGDGVYTVKLYVLPQWDVTVTYDVNSYVFDANFYYKCLVQNTNKNPSQNPTIWELVPNIDNIGVNYISEGKFAITCDLQNCYITTLKQAIMAQNCFSCNNTKLCNIKEWVAANQLLLILDNIAGLVNIGAWNDVTNLINKGKQICCCSGL